MPAVNLTARSVENWKPAPKKRQEIPDGLVTGLYLVVTERGAKSWALRYRHAGKPRKLTLGQYPALPLADVRELARQALIRVAKGEDPAADKAVAAAAAKAEKEAEAIAIKDKFINVADLFRHRYMEPKNRSASESSRILAKVVVPVWGERSIHEISRRDVIELLDSIVDRGSPIMANRVLALVRKLFNWAIERGIIEASPVAGIKAPGKEESRDRVLTDGELAEVLAAADKMGWPFGAVVKLLVLTGQRRDEVSTMKWSDVDFGRSLWTIPAAIAKNNRIHEVPLTPAAVTVLSAAPRGSDLVFSTTGRTPVSGFSRAKEKIDALVTENRGEPLPDWRLHDLRRTAASGMARLGVPPHVVEKLLNHSSGTIKGVAAVYNRHQYQDECRQAAELWARHVGGLFSGLAI